MLRVRTSRRVAGLKSADYDHTIDLINHDESQPSRPPSLAVGYSAASATSPTSPVNGTGPAAAVDNLAAGEATRLASGKQHEPSGEPGPARSAREPNEPSIEVKANAYHKASPTSIHTAQVPDPSWEWVWPEWRVNHQDGLDQDGWEYSFAFSNKFSWHGPKWWNSFVRRRAWTRKRAKKKLQDASTDPYTLNSDYFVIHPTSHRSRLSNRSFESSCVPRKSNLSQLSTSEIDELVVVTPDIEDMETLLRTLRLARIDREKREAVENYLNHATDLWALQEEMHAIMSLFIFQASRKQLLGRLMREHDKTMQQLGKKSGGGDDAAFQERKRALDAAIRHAGEEVRKLAFWSDVKQMAEDGELRDSFDSEQG